MYMVSEPPLPAIDDVSFTHADAEVALGAQDEVHDSSHAFRGEVQAVSEQNLMFPRSDAS